MTWRGARTAFYCATCNGPAFVAVLLFLDLLNERGLAGIGVHIKPVRDYEKGGLRTGLDPVKLRDIFLEDIPFEGGRGLDMAQATHAYEGRVMTAQIWKEAVFDNYMFVRDLFSSDFGRKVSEAALDG